MWSIAQAQFNGLVQLSGGVLSNHLHQSLLLDSILSRGALSTEQSLAFDSCQQLTSYKVKWSIAEAGRLDEKVITGHSGQVLTRTMSQQSTPRPMSKVQKKEKKKANKGLAAQQGWSGCHCTAAGQNSQVSRS